MSQELYMTDIKC